MTDGVAQMGPGLWLPLETTTPLFLNGPEPRRSPELRPPAFRGALRFWLRALLGGALGDSPGGLRALREREARIFGSAGSDDSGGSALIVRARPVGAQKREILAPDTKYPKGGSGRDYLYWSLLNVRGGDEPTVYFPAGTTFDLGLVPRPGAPRADEAFDLGLCALWLLVHLGGVGSRSRRTAGSLSARGEPDNVATRDLPFVLSGSPAEAAAQLGEGLARVRERAGRAAGNGAPEIAGQFDVLHPDVCRIWALKTWNTSDEAVRMIGHYMKEYRASLDDKRAIAAWLDGAPDQRVERVAFGLPMPVRHRGKMVTVGPRGGQSEQINRRASPLWLHVSKTAGGKYLGVATLFKSRFLPEGARIDGGRHNDRVPPIDPPADYDVIEQFIASEFKQAREVTYS